MLSVLADIQESVGVRVTREFTEDDLAGLYAGFKADGDLESIFWMGIPKLSEFLLWYTQENAALIFSAEDVEEPVGIGWINNTRKLHLETWDATVEVGFAMREWYRKRNLRCSLEAAWAVLGIAFDLHPNAGVALGMTPAPNRRALMFARMLGMKLHGPIPNYAAWNREPCAAYISSITRKDYYGRRK